MQVRFDFKQTRFVVTGASSGLGFEIVQKLVDSNAYVLAIARREERLELLSQSNPERISICASDVNNRDRILSAIQQFAKFGKISGSVHSAGISKYTPIRSFKKSDAMLIMDGLWAAIDIVAMLSSSILSSQYASHVLISSVSAMRGQAGLTAYSSAKAATLGAVRSMSRELAPKSVRINAISPGWIPTEMTASMERFLPGGAEQIVKDYPLGIGSPSDVANLTLYLLSDASRWITGANFVIDGGFSA